MINRRDFLSSLLAMGGAAVLKPLDPVDPNIRYGITGALWGDWPNGTLRMSTDMQQIVTMTARFGLQGIEPYARQIADYLPKPLALKQMCEAAGIRLIDVGDLPPAQLNAKAYPEAWISKDGNAQLISNMVRFAHDFLAPCGCDHWKTNMGARPVGGPTEDQLKHLAGTLNEIGRQTIAVGVKLAPHPHIWGPMEREREIRRVMELTDPRYVWLTADTAHLTLGGGDAVAMIRDYFSRVAEVHLKDTYARYRGNASTPTLAEHTKASLYHNLGAGGVDFPALFKLLRGRNFKGWVVYDLDAPRPDDGTGSIEQNLAVNINYLRNELHVKLPPPPRA
ncbi:MAG: sugar phosphate isomerase/epimerase [Acidobacteriaceae bacterium]